MPLTCKICFESAHERKQAKITICGHVFCEECSSIWFQKESACPVCRKQINVSDQLISLFDQDAGMQMSTSDSAQADNISASQLSVSVSSEADIMDESPTVQMKSVFGKLTEKWQQMVIERAKLKYEVARLGLLNSEISLKLKRVEVENTNLHQKLQEQSALIQGIRNAVEVMPESGSNQKVMARFATDSRTSTLLTSLETGTSQTKPESASFLTKPEAIIPAQVENRLRAPKWELESTFNNHSQPLHGIAVSPGGSIVATASWDHTCKLFDVESSAEVATLHGHSLGLYAVKFSPPHLNLVGTVSSDKTCRLWNVTDGKNIAVLEAHTDEVNGLSFHPHSSLVATASDDTTAILWDMEKKLPLTIFKGHENVAYGICFQPNSNVLATASFDWTTKLWDFRTGNIIKTLQGHTEDVIGVDFDDSGYYLATGSDDATCRVWDVRMGLTLSVLNHHAGEVKRVAFSPHSLLLATTSGDATIRLFQSSNFNCSHILSSHTDHVFDVSWSPKAEFIVSASHDKSWKLWTPNLFMNLKMNKKNSGSSKQYNYL